MNYIESLKILELIKHFKMKSYNTTLININGKMKIIMII